MNVEQVSAAEFIENAYIQFGKEVNLQRQIPLIMDGLKPSYRRVLYSMYELPDKLNKLVKIAGHTIAEYHGHKDVALYPVLTNLEHRGIIDGNQGNYGYTALYGPSCDAAAPRYLEAKLEPKYRKLFGEVIKYIPTEVTDVGGRMPIYLPTPIPFVLMMGTSGMGIGCAVNIPAFTFQSLVDAYLADDPNLLEPNSSCILDKEKSDLSKLWKKGRGRLYFSYTITSHTTEDGEKGYIIEGDPDLFKPDLSIFNSWLSDKLIFFQDMSTGSHKRLFIGKNKRVSKITLDDIKKKLKSITSWSDFYYLNVSDGNKVRKISMYDWIHLTYTNYLSLLSTMQEDMIKSCKHEIKVLKAVDPVVKVILQNPKIKKSKIADKTGLSESIVSDVLKKSISKLLTEDLDNDMSKIKERLESWESYNPQETLTKLITKL